MQFSTASLRPVALAVGTLTVIRVRVAGRVAPAELRAAVGFYPLVGLLVGALPALALLAPVPDLPRAVLALAVWVVVTGALHLDGWTDCCDAAFAPPRATAAETRTRRLAILKDPHVGVFGVAGLVLLLLAKWTVLIGAAPLAPLLAAPLARWTMVFALHAHPAARPDGLAATLGRSVPLNEATWILALILAPLTFLAAEPWRVAGAVAFGILSGLGVAALLARRFGGVTGDVLGASGEAVELAVLWALLG